LAKVDYKLTKYLMHKLNDWTQVINEFHQKTNRS